MYVEGDGCYLLVSRYSQGVDPRRPETEVDSWSEHRLIARGTAGMRQVGTADIRDSRL